MKGQQSGFTMIELLIVIVLLGILAATALPRFADFTGDARTAAVNGFQGNIAAAAQIVHAGWLMNGQVSPVVLQDGTSVVVNATGWPVVTLTATDATQDTAEELFNKMVTGGTPDPSVWTATETPNDTTGTFTFTAQANCFFTYDGTAGNVTSTVTGC